MEKTLSRELAGWEIFVITYWWWETPSSTMLLFVRKQGLKTSEACCVLLSCIIGWCPVIPKAITPNGACGVLATDPFLPAWQTERYHVTNRTIWFPGCFWSPMLNKSRCAKSLLAFLQGHGRNRHWKNHLGEINSVSNPRQELPDGGLVFLHQPCLSSLDSTVMGPFCFTGHRWSSHPVIYGWLRLFPKPLSVCLALWGSHMDRIHQHRRSLTAGVGEFLTCIRRHSDTAKRTGMPVRVNVTVWTVHCWSPVMSQGS